MSAIPEREEPNTSRSQGTGRKRRTYSAAFKAKVVLESLDNNADISQIANRNGLHPNQVKNWRTCMRKRLSQLFVDQRTISGTKKPGPSPSSNQQEPPIEASQRPDERVQASGRRVVDE